MLSSTTCSHAATIWTVSRCKSYSLTDADTLAREAGALAKLPNVHPCRRRVIITYDEEGTLTDKQGSIEVIPCWKWLLSEAVTSSRNE